MASNPKSTDISETPTESPLQVVTHQIVEAALGEIRTRYTKERYHNPEHTGMVVAEAVELGKNLESQYRLSEKERCLLQLAAAAHDVRYDKNPRLPGYDGENEKDSAGWIETHMRAHYPDIFNEADIQMVRTAVLATRARPHPSYNPETGWSAETTIQQNVGEGGSAPTHLIAQLLCDADLSGFGRPWDTYTDTMTGYYLELNPNGGTEKTWRAYLEFQNILLTNRRYFTQVARDRYGQNLLENIGKTTHILNHRDSFTTCFKDMERRAGTIPKNPEN